METTNQNNLDEIISQDTEKINNDEQTKSEIVYIEVDKYIHMTQILEKIQVM